MSYYSSQEWKILRDYVVDRDNYTCQECGYHKHNEEDRELNAHHVIPRKEGGIDHPENLVTLCKGCHGKLEGERRNPRNPDNALFEDFIDWCSEDSLKKIIDEEIKNTVSYYDFLFKENSNVCSKCLNYTSTSEEYHWIENHNGDIKTCIKRINALVPMKFYKFSIDLFDVCKCCSYKEGDFIKPFKEHREAMKDAHKIVEYLNSCDIEFDIDIFYSCFKYLHKNSNQYKDEDCFRRSLQIAIDYENN